MRKRSLRNLASLAKATDVKTAIKEADIVILSVWFSTIQELFKQYATELNGKIVIDPSNPIAPDGNGGFKKIIGADESAGQILKGLLPTGAKLVKALGFARCGLTGQCMLLRILARYCFMLQMIKVLITKLKN